MSFKSIFLILQDWEFRTLNNLAIRLPSRPSPTATDERTAIEISNGRPLLWRTHSNQLTRVKSSDVTSAQYRSNRMETLYLLMVSNFINFILGSQFLWNSIQIICQWHSEMQSNFEVNFAQFKNLMPDLRNYITIYNVVINCMIWEA